MEQISIMKKYLIAIFFIPASLFFIACGNSSSANSEPASTTFASTGADGKSGIGKFTKVELNTPLDEAMVANGEKIFTSKCLQCHKLTDEKLVGPGWKGVTSRFTPEWIMNFTTNTEYMLNNDVKAKALLATWLVKMPPPNLADEEARAVLEFMRKNDGEK
jgi:cytochrome c551/c552